MKKLRYFWLLFICLGLIIFVPACANNKDTNEKMNCSIIYSDHANSKNQISELKKYVENTKKSEGYISYIRLDGDPQCVLHEQTENQNKNAKRIKKEVNSYITSSLKKLKEIKAKSPEVDIMKSFSAASESLNSADFDEGKDTYENVVVIMGTGLSTKGIVDFSTNGLASLDLDNYKEWIIKSGQLPDLSNIDKIYWYNFDSTFSPQDEFSTNDLKNKLKDFYKDILATAGVKDVEINYSGNGTNPSSDLPKVSSVTMPPKPKYNVGDQAEISADVLFNGDSSTFLDGADPSQNKDIIEIANSTKINNLKLKIIGYTAHHDTTAEGGNESLSKNRAEAMKSVLVSMGCAAENIETVGGGYGPYDNDKANRCVTIQFS